MEDFSKDASSFTSDFYFSGSEPCNTPIRPGLEASDDLSLSNLIVGKRYSYCVRAVKQDHYMDSPYEGGGERRLLTSSESTCGAHTITWEASIHGKVTTEPNAGSLPIEDVSVTWSLLSLDFKALDCEGCSGHARTDKGGAFTIPINADHPSLKGINEDEIPVRIFFSKQTPASPKNIAHIFLCNDGADQCDEVHGHIVYLSHLQFAQPLHIYDDTSVPFSGKISIADTGGPEGCPINGVKICLMHLTTLGQREELVCGETNSDGVYSLPIVMGSTVNEVDVSYRNHKFMPTSDEDYESGVVIMPAGIPYTNHDFEDVTKSSLIVEVVGGRCNTRLGDSKVLIKVANCNWGGITPDQSGIIKTYFNIPAHLTHVEVIEIDDSVTNARIEPIWNEFQGDRPVIRVIDLRDSSAADEAFKAEEDSLAVETNKGTENTENEEQEKEDEAELKKLEKGDLETVRFQYDGVLTMKVFIDDVKDQRDCMNYALADYGNAQSLHVIDYLELFTVDVKLAYEIVNGVFCDIVDDDLKILVNNQVGIDGFAGYEEFEKRITDKNTLRALKFCSALNPDDGGACVFDVTHTTDDEGNPIGNAGIKNLVLATGRPNIVFPYTKNLIFKVLGGTSDVEHKAAICVEGLYSKGPGNSFALPTHEPIMILRDPPGKLGLSLAFDLFVPCSSHHPPLSSLLIAIFRCLLHSFILCYPQVGSLMQSMRMW